MYAAPSRPVSNRLEVKDGKLHLHGSPIELRYGRRGVQIGCHFVTYDALDRIYEESQR